MLKIEKKMRFFKEAMLTDMDYNDQVKVVIFIGIQAKKYYPKNIIGKVAYYFNPKVYPKGAKIYFQGDPVKFVYLIQQGRIELHSMRMEDVLDLKKIESDVDQLKILERNAKELYGITNTWKVYQKVCEIGERSILADWVEPQSKNPGLPRYNLGIYSHRAHNQPPPTQMFTAVVVSEEVTLFECTFDNFNWVKETYPELWIKTKARIVEQNQQRKDYLEQVTETLKQHERTSKGITNKNHKVKVFAVQANSAALSMITPEEKKFGRKYLDEDFLKIDTAVNKRIQMMKKIQTEYPLGDEPMDDMIRQQEKYYQIMQKREERLQRRYANRKPTEIEPDPNRCQRFRYSVDYSKFLGTFYRETRDSRERSTSKEASMSKIYLDVSSSTAIGNIMQSGITDEVLKTSVPVVKQKSLMQAVQDVLKKQSEKLNSEDGSKDQFFRVMPGLVKPSYAKKSPLNPKLNKSDFMERLETLDSQTKRARSQENTYIGVESSLFDLHKETSSVDNRASRLAGKQPQKSVRLGGASFRLGGKQSRLKTSTNLTLSTREVSLLASTRSVQ